MDAYLQPQLKNHQEIKNILKQVNVTHVLSDGRKVKTLLVYLPIKNGVREGANKSYGTRAFTGNPLILND